MVHESLRIVKDREHGNMTEYVGYKWQSPYNVNSVCGGECCNPMPKLPKAPEKESYDYFMTSCFEHHLEEQMMMEEYRKREATAGKPAEQPKEAPKPKQLKQTVLPVKSEKGLFQWG